MASENLTGILDSTRISQADKQQALRCLITLTELSWDRTYKTLLEKDQIEDLYTCAFVKVTVIEHALGKYSSQYAD